MEILWKEDKKWYPGRIKKVNEDGTYGTPENLGPGINTEHREQFPFVSEAIVLYFALDKLSSQTYF